MAVAKVMSTGTAAASDKKDVWIPTACGMCYTNCGILVHVKDGKVIGLEGNPIHPQNRGLMCAKGKAGIMNLYNPNRVLTPLKRTNPKKGIGVDPKWVEISWDEALDTITSRLGDLKDDPQKLFLQIWEVIGDNYKWLAALAAAFGTPNVMTASSPSCGKVIHPMEFLSGGGFHQQPDLHYCKYALLVGTQIGTAARGCFNHMATDYAEARKRGMKVVVVDPISSYAGAKADEWIPIRPGTDSAFALGLMNVLVNELGIYDAPYLKKYTNAPYLVGPDGTYVRDPNLGNPLVFDSTFQKGVSYDSATPEVALEGSYQVAGVKCAPAFQVLKDHLRSFTPEKMSEITTVPAATIRRVAREFGAAAQVGATTIIKGQISHGDDISNLLRLSNWEKINHSHSFRQSRSRFRNFIALKTENPAPVSEEEEVVMGIGRSQEPDGIIFSGYHADDALAAPVLQGVKLGGHPFDKATGTERHDDSRMRNQVFLAEFHLTLVAYLGPPVITEFGLQVAGFLFNERQHPLRISQEVFQIGDGLQDFGILVKYSLPLKISQAAQLHIENRLRLKLAQGKTAHQTGASPIGIFRFADSSDYFVYLVQGNLETFEDMRPGFSPFQVEPGTAGNHLPSEVYVILKRLFKAEHPGLAVNQSQHIDVESRLHSRVFVKTVKHFLGLSIPLQLDDDAHALSVRLISQLADAFDFLGCHQGGDSLYQTRLVCLIRQLNDHNLAAFRLGGLGYVSFSLNHNASVAGSVGALNAIGT